MGYYLSHTKIELSLMNLELLKRLSKRLIIDMIRTKENLMTIRNGRTRRMKSLTKGRKVPNLLDSGINKSSHPKLGVIQLE